MDVCVATEEEKEEEGGMLVGDVQTTSERKMKFQEVGICYGCTPYHCYIYM